MSIFNDSMADALSVARFNACPCCDSTTLRQLRPPAINIGSEHFASVRGQLGIDRCTTCGLTFTNPRPSEELLIGFYNRDGYGCHNPAFDASTAKQGDIVRLSLVEAFCANGSLLDFGAGAGHLLRLARQRGWKRVSGVELGDKARQALIEEGFDMFKDLNTWRTYDAQVDAIMMIHVLEHLTHISPTLRAIHDVLSSSGGIFHVEVPNADSLRARLANSPLKPLWTAHPERYSAFPIHLLYFNPQSFRRVLERHNFRILKMGTLGLGVEELFGRRSGGATDAAGGLPGQPNPGLDHDRGRPARRSGWLKAVVKNTMSSLCLGENLYAICQPADNGQRRPRQGADGGVS